MTWRKHQVTFSLSLLLSHSLSLSLSLSHPEPLWSWLLALGVFKRSCSTPFTLFLLTSFSLPALSTIFHSKNSPQYLCFQLPSYSLFLPNRPFSCIYLQHNSSLYSSSCSLRSPSDPACLPCAASRVGEDGILVAEVPGGIQHASSARTSPRRVVGLARPNQSAGHALP